MARCLVFLSLKTNQIGNKEKRKQEEKTQQLAFKLFVEKIKS